MWYFTIRRPRWWTWGWERNTEFRTFAFPLVIVPVQMRQDCFVSLHPCPIINVFATNIHTYMYVHTPYMEYSHPHERRLLAVFLYNSWHVSHMKVVFVYVLTYTDNHTYLHPPKCSSINWRNRITSAATFEPLSLVSILWRSSVVMKSYPGEF